MSPPGTPRARDQAHLVVEVLRQQRVLGRAGFEADLVLSRRQVEGARRDRLQVQEVDRGFLLPPAS